MEVLFSCFLMLTVIACAALLGSVKGKKTANNAIKLFEAREAEWQKRGLSKDEIDKNMKICWEVIMSLKVTDLTGQEYLDRCKRVLDDQEDFIFNHYL